MITRAHFTFAVCQLMGVRVRICVSLRILYIYICMILACLYVWLYVLSSLPFSLTTPTHMYVFAGNGEIFTLSLAFR